MTLEFPAQRDQFLSFWALVPSMWHKMTCDIIKINLWFEFPSNPYKLLFIERDFSPATRYKLVRPHKCSAHSWVIHRFPIKITLKIQ